MAIGKDLRFGPLNETKGQVMTRLREGGRWTEFIQQRDQLLAAGLTGREAWEQLVPFFQPTASEPAATNALAPVVENFPDVTAFDGDFDQTSIDVAGDVAWVYNNFGAQVSPAPSPGAVEMLRWARRNRTKFFSDVVAKVRPADDDVEDRKLRDDGRQVFDVIERFQHANKPLAVGDIYAGSNPETSP